MPPQPALLDSVAVEGVNLGQLLRTMNQRIEVLLDRDHCLGHAYFLPLQADRTLAKLEAIFRHQILPLLQEYFFEDWQRIQWVLNDHRKVVADRFVYQIQQDVKSMFGEGVNASAHNLPWRINDEAFGRATAYLGIIDPILQPSIESEPQPNIGLELQAGEDKLLQEALYEAYLIRRLTSGTIEVLRDGILQTPTLEPLRKMANKLGVPYLYDHGGPLNTRELGRRLIVAIETSAA
jgi:5-methylcytosine-specific restriction protein B